MSYYSWMNLQYTSDGRIDISELTGILAADLDRKGISRDVIMDLTSLFSTNSAMIKLPGEIIDKILMFISEKRPHAPFGVQGRGEELRDVWVREYDAGKSVFAEGPFHWS